MTHAQPNLTYLVYRLTSISVHHISKYFSSHRFGLQERIRVSLAWGFQKRSELLPVFNYYLHKMQQTGLVDRMLHKFIGNSKMNTDATTIPDINVLGYQNVAFPFLALLTGLLVAPMLLGIEIVIIRHKTCANDEEQANGDDGAVTTKDRETWLISQVRASQSQ